MHNWKIMDRMKRICAILISVSAVAIASFYGSQFYKQWKNQKELENHYAWKLKSAYVRGYATNQNGELLMSQSRFERSLEEIEEKMLSEGLNSAQIEKMKDEARSKGQEKRAFWDNYYAEIEKKKSRSN
jgi:hypothetical protein